MLFRAICILAVLPGLLVLARESRAQSVTDTNFSASDWTTTPFVAGGGWVAHTNSNTSGPPNTPPYDFLVDKQVGPAPAPSTGVPSPAARTLGVHIYNTPLTSGAPIGSVSMSIWTLCLPGPCAAGHGIGIALKQNGRLYVALGSGTLVTGPPGTAWRPQSVTRQQTDFCEVVAASQFALGGQVCNSASQPDFSPGANPIRCGFFTLQHFARDPAWPSYSYTMQSLYDDWSCSANPPSLGSLTIFKALTIAPSPLLVLTGPWPWSTAFNVSVNCGGSGPGSVTLIPPLLATTISSLPYGTTCTITEPALPPSFTSGSDTCTWQQQAPLSQTVTINAPTQSVTVTNTLYCGATPTAPTAPILLHKSLSHPPGVMAPTGVTYNVTVTCGSSSQTLAVPTSGKATTQQFDVGSTCTIQETLPAQCTWGATTYRRSTDSGFTILAPVTTNTYSFTLIDDAPAPGSNWIDIENQLLAPC
jgi:Domain of unknown function (DUF5979)